MKMTVFWDVAPCSMIKLTDVSEVLTAFIVRATVTAVCIRRNVTE
jgi:hypothetical protein